MSLTAGYLTVPIETDADSLAQAAFDAMAAAFPGWEPAEGDLLTRFIRANAQMAAETRDIASAVPSAVFRSFGATMMNLPPIEAAHSTGSVTITVQDTAGYTIPAGTAMGIQGAGGDLVEFQIASDVTIAPGSNTTAVGGVQIVSIETGIDTGDLSGTPQLITPISFISTITLVGTTTGGADAETDDAYLAKLVAELQTMAPRPILAVDVPVFVRNISGVARSVALDNYRPDHNLLTANQASVETDTTGFTAGTNCSVAASADFAADGAKSLKLTSTAGGDMSVQTLSGLSAVPILAGQLVTGLASFRSAVSARSTKSVLRWYDAAGAFLSESLGTAANDATGSFAQRSVTASAPTNAAFVAIKVLVSATGAGSEIHYVDKLAIRVGADTNWNPGGTSATGNPKCLTTAAVDSAGSGVSSGIKAEIIADLQGRREANFLFFVIDPTYSTIDVAFTATAIRGFDTADVNTRGTAAVVSWLSSARWGVPSTGASNGWIDKPIVRRLKLAQIIEDVAGVEELTALTINGAAADFTMPGPIAMPNVGTVTGTVNAGS